MELKEFILGFIITFIIMIGIATIPTYLKEGIKQIIKEIRNKN